MKIVAEAGLGHDGSLRYMLDLVDAVAVAGADALKGQCHEGDKCNTFRPGTSFPQDADRQAYYRRTAFDRKGWEQIANRCHELGLEFGCSVWSQGGIVLLRDLVDFWKVPSGEVTNQELLEALAHEGKPVVLSSGMSTVEEIRASRELLINSYDPPLVTVLQCTTQYPCHPESIGLNRIAPNDQGRNDFFGAYDHCSVVGLSDHSGTIWPGIIAAWLGASMLEVHVCWSKEQSGPDVSSSLTIAELRQLVEGVRFVEKMRDNPVDKDALAASEAIQEMRKVFMR